MIFSMKRLENSVKSMLTKAMHSMSFCSNGSHNFLRKLYLVKKALITSQMRDMVVFLLSLSGFGCQTQFTKRVLSNQILKSRQHFLGEFLGKISLIKVSSHVLRFPKLSLLFLRTSGKKMCQNGVYPQYLCPYPTFHAIKHNYE